MSASPACLEAAILAELWWQHSPTSALLDDGQQEWVDRFRAGDGHGVWMIGRQRGKTFAALTMACEVALQTPGAIIRYAAKTAKSAESIVLPTLRQVLASCPEALAPTITELRGVATWPNGSVLTWAGTDNEQFDRLRGPRAHLILLDESAFYSRLEEVEAALIPQLTTTGGKCLYLSTPPESPSHPFVQRYNAAKARDMAEHETLMDNPRLGPDGAARLLRAEADRLGQTAEEFLASTYCRREYLADIVTEESRAAMPAFTVERSRELVREWPRPTHFDGYVSLDLGLEDGHGALFGFFDYPAQKLIIEDELFLRRSFTDALAAGIKAKETALWGASKFDGTLFGAKDWKDVPDWLRDAISETAPRQPYLRVADNELLVLGELHRQYGLAFLPTAKDDKHLAVDAVNVAIARGEIIIHPRCVQLVSQLHSTLWDRHRRQWERTPEGHGEGVDCLVYMWRNIRRHRNPAPPPPRDAFLEHLIAGTLQGKQNKRRFGR